MNNTSIKFLFKKLYTGRTAFEHEIGSFHTRK